MEAINQKEKSKKVWQFLFIFILPLLTVVGILYSYYKLPVLLMEENLKKVESGSQYNRMQKQYSNQISSMDSIFTEIQRTTDESKQSELVSIITTKLIIMQKSDSSDLIKSISKLVKDHIQHLISYYNIKGKIEKAEQDAIMKAEEKKNLEMMQQSQMPPDPTLNNSNNQTTGGTPVQSW